MNAALLHRGPDGAGEFISRQVMLAMRRLSIIDLKGGWQPLYNEDRSIVLVANGEIYNHVEIRDDLEKRGHRFSTHSDCETILHLYEEHGPDCVHHLRGMFAFALWDAVRKRLVLARDRMGEKPLYFFRKGNHLLFASELRALLGSGMVPFDLDPDAVNLYFHYHYVPEPLTPITGVEKLPAAHYLVIDTNPWRMTATRYWRLEDAEPIDEDPPTRIREVLEDVARIVVRSDVPVGVALSGGLDSSAVAALAVRHCHEEVHAFSVGYPGRPACDERADAKAMADHLGMPFHEIELHSEDMVAFFPELVWRRGDPIADISGYGYYAVTRIAREHGVPVVLQGQGGDELFWYEDVRDAAKQTSRKQALLNRQVGFLDYLRLVPPPSFQPRRIAGWALKGRWISGIREYRRDRSTPAEQMVYMETDPDFLRAKERMYGLYTDEFSERLDRRAPERLYEFSLPWPDIPVALTRLIIDTYLAENGIAQGDRLAMSNSVELRLPFVDHKLVETVIGLRRCQPDHCLPPKTWLKQAVAGLVPDWMIAMPKRGFTPPGRDWSQRLFQEYGGRLVDGELVGSGVLTRDAGRLLSRGLSPRSGWNGLSFKALVLELWVSQCRAFSVDLVS